MIAAFFTRIPRWAWGALALVALAIGFRVWLSAHVRAERAEAVAEYKDAVAEAVARKAAQGDIAAAKAAQAVQRDATKILAAAEKAAAESDDPLADFIGGLD